MAVLRTLARQLQLVAPKDASYDELMALIARRIKELGWPEDWVTDADLDPIEHGTAKGYGAGCRCGSCRGAHFNDKPPIGLLPYLRTRGARL